MPDRPYELLKDLYLLELDRRTSFEEATTLRVATIAALAAAIGYLSEHTPIDWNLRTAWSVSWGFVAIGCGLYTIAALIRSFLGYRWHYLPPPDAILVTYRDMCKYHLDVGYDHGGPQDALQEQLLDRLAEAATNNHRNNNSRSELLHQATFALSIAAVAMLLAGVPVVHDAIRRNVMRKEDTNGVQRPQTRATQAATNHGRKGRTDQAAATDEQKEVREGAASTAAPSVEARSPVVVSPKQ